jgi:RimJ/RimL family protein N-acetyltransferase
VISTERLVLRRWREADAEAHHRMCAEPDVARFLGPSPTLEDSRDVIVRQNAIADRFGSCFWAIEHRVDGSFIGWCGVKPGPDGTPIAGEPEIGWSLARPVWGRGLAIEAAHAALTSFWGVGSRAARVTAITVPANVRSQSVMIRLGMTRVTGGDFDHPALPEGNPLRRHLIYAIARP